MNDIDISEKLKKEEYQKLIIENEYLKSENKEMKEENDLLKSKLNIWENLKNEDFIPKSKVEEEIHYFKKCKDFAKTGKFKEAQIQTELLEAVIKKLEQSLLGKE